MRGAGGRANRVGSETRYRVALTGAIEQPLKDVAARTRAQRGGSAGPRLLALLVLLLAVGFVSLLIGRYPISPVVVLRILVSALLPATEAPPDTMTTVVLEVRVPRVAAGAIGRASCRERV